MKVLRLLGRHKWLIDSNSFVMRMALVLLPAVALSACSGANLANPSASTSSDVRQISATLAKFADASPQASPASGNTAICGDSPSDARD